MELSSKFLTKKIVSEFKNRCKKQVEKNTSALYRTIDNPISLMLQEETIVEGLIRTYSPDVIVNYTCKSLGIDESQVTMGVLNGNVRIGFEIPHKDSLVSDVKKAMQVGGYHFVLKEKSPNVDNWCILVFEGTHLLDVANEIRGNYRYLYHITPTKLVTKILNIGLKPSARNVRFNYPSRTHLLITHPNNEIDFVYDLISSKEEEEWTCLTIDLEKVKDYVQFHLDTSCNIGVYTNDNIGPEAIIKVEKLLLKDF